MIGQRYEILERVGEGAYFHVARARDQSLNRIVAVKVPRAAAMADQAFCSALRGMAAQSASLTHPNVARVYELCESDDHPVLVTEFARGMNLKERIKRIAPFTLSVAVDFAIAIGEAVQSAHSAGVLHGDLRPQNVLVSPDGVVKVTDFGMGAVLAAAPAVAAPQVAENAAYLAPEVRSGGPLTIASDVYALGVILYEMLTGVLPAGEGAIAGPRVLNSGVPVALDGVVMKASHASPQVRYAIVGDVLSDLRTIRDALRFGRPLSWTPLQQPPPEPPTAQRVSAPVHNPVRPAAAAPAEAAPAPAASEPAASGATTMGRPSGQDDGVSPVIKIAIGMVLGLILIVVIVGVAVWMSTVSAPKASTIGNLVGMTLDQAKSITSKADVRLIPHEEFNDHVERNQIIRSDQDPTRQTYAGRAINVWVSRGSRMVSVPELVRLSAAAAEARIRDAGLTLGKVERAYSSAVAADSVVVQSPRPGKRVLRDSVINLTMSDGADPNGGEGVVPEGSGGSSERASETEAGRDSEPQIYNLRIRIPSDLKGSHRVRVECEDANGTQTPVDEGHDPGDRIDRQVEVYGDQVTVRVFYDDETDPVSTRTEKIRRQRR